VTGSVNSHSPQPTIGRFGIPAVLVIGASCNAQFAISSLAVGGGRNYIASGYSFT